MLLKPSIWYSLHVFSYMDVACDVIIAMVCIVTHLGLVNLIKAGLTPRGLVEVV